MYFKFTFCPIILLLWASLSFAQNVNVVIHGAASIAKTDDNFVCVTLDWWPAEKCDYNQCPWGKGGILNLDLRYGALINAIKGEFYAHPIKFTRVRDSFYPTKSPTYDGKDNSMGTPR
ncbi:hypothetical protein HRI_003114900 [Hibiscus trionum]|uniref:Uncharacterized protein n=1 Tax=Hibiscus trionum TaxID=183268 RepID=A0A9W7IFR2_HIBTR|nr:hypothetical protein HRI_003114900 [Hibiscus trionum]